MAVEMYEMVDSRPLSVDQNNREITTLWFVRNESGDASTDYSDTYTYIRLNTPTRRDGLLRSSITGKRLGGAGGGLWEYEVKYKPNVVSEVGLGEVSNGSTDPNGGAANAPNQNALRALGPEFAFQTGGGTTHITQSLSTVQSFAEVGNAPNLRKAIGVTDNEVQGTDIITPAPVFSIKVKRQNVNFLYYHKLCFATGKTNDRVVAGKYERGELLYLGADGNYTTDNMWDITHQFAYSENRLLTPQDIANNLPAVPVFTKRGWDYLWVQYRHETIENKLRKQADAVYIEQVYQEYDFRELEIGI